MRPGYPPVCWLVITCLAVMNITWAAGENSFHLSPRSAIVETAQPVQEPPYGATWSSNPSYGHGMAWWFELLVPLFLGFYLPRILPPDTVQSLENFLPLSPMISFSLFWGLHLLKDRRPNWQAFFNGDAFIFAVLTGAVCSVSVRFGVGHWVSFFCYGGLIFAHWLSNAWRRAQQAARISVLNYDWIQGEVNARWLVYLTIAIGLLGKISFEWVDLMGISPWGLIAFGVGYICLFSYLETKTNVVSLRLQYSEWILTHSPLPLFRFWAVLSLFGTNTYTARDILERASTSQRDITLFYLLQHFNPPVVSRIERDLEADPHELGIPPREVPPPQSPLPNQRTTLLAYTNATEAAGSQRPFDRVIKVIPSGRPPVSVYVGDLSAFEETLPRFQVKGETVEEVLRHLYEDAPETHQWLRKNGIPRSGVQVVRRISVFGRLAPSLTAPMDYWLDSGEEILYLIPPIPEGNSNPVELAL